VPFTFYGNPDAADVEPVVSKYSIDTAHAAWR
jgi:hypothetical protein